VHTRLVGFVVPNPIGYTRTPRAAAIFAASTGSIPAVFLPSVSRTTISGAKGTPPADGAGSLEPSVPPWPPGPPLPVGASPSARATFGSISAMASIDFRIAAPIVVPRPVVSESMVSSRGFRSVVGATAI
jgi:hypothetical protein